MKKTAVALLALLCLLLGGCASWMDGAYHSVTPYMVSGSRDEGSLTSVSNHTQLRMALEDIVEDGAESRLISLVNFDTDKVKTHMEVAIRHILQSNPVGAYAVESIDYELGTTGGVPAMIVNVQYNNNRGEINRIRRVKMNDARKLITTALDQVQGSIVLRISDYQVTDYAQLVQDYALAHPESVMEIPQITVNTYPQSGTERILELLFSYQTSRDSLKDMQRYVQPVFTSTTLYVSAEETEEAKFARLYALLMETRDYTLETSITPAYSLLRHGVGDSKTVATVFAAMCGKAQLECMTVTGTRAGEPWVWNIICENGVYYHVDLFNCYRSGGYRKQADSEMAGYVWDFAAYPACGLPEEMPQETAE
jgi:hypothetical protein